MSYDIAVVGAGVFGVWTAHQLSLKGAAVLLLDAYGPGNSRASSGGESRILRLGYGPDQIYSQSAQRSLTIWKDFFERTGHRLFERTGVLWLARGEDPYSEATLKTLHHLGANCERLSANELATRFPQLELGAVNWGILEPDSGVLLARQAVQAVSAEAQANGVEYLQEAIASPAPENGKLSSLKTTAGKEIVAGCYVFACGPWLPKLFPDLLGELIYVTRQEVI